MNTDHIESLARTQPPAVIRESIAILPAMLGVDTYEHLDTDEFGRGTMTVRAAAVVCHFTIDGHGAMPVLAKVTRDGSEILDASGTVFFGELLNAGLAARSDPTWTLTEAEVDANIAAFAAAVGRIEAAAQTSPARDDGGTLGG